MENNLRQHAIDLIRNYWESEFGDRNDVLDTHSIGLAYTTWSVDGLDWEPDVQVTLDLDGLTMYGYFDNRLVCKDEYGSLELLVDELKWIDFNDLVSWVVDHVDLEAFAEEYDGVDTTPTIPEFVEFQGHRGMSEEDATRLWYALYKPDEYEEYDEGEKRRARYTVIYEGFLFEGDSATGVNYHDYDDWKEVQSLIDFYGDVIEVEHNEYGVRWAHGEWF